MHQAEVQSLTLLKVTYNPSDHHNLEKNVKFVPHIWHVIPRRRCGNDTQPPLDDPTLNSNTDCLGD